MACRHGAEGEGGIEARPERAAKLMSFIGQEIRRLFIERWALRHGRRGERTRSGVAVGRYQVGLRCWTEKKLKLGPGFPNGISTRSQVLLCKLRGAREAATRAQSRVRVGCGRQPVLPRLTSED